MKTSDILKIIVGFVVVFGALTLTMLEFPVFSNTSEIGKVLLIGGAIWIPVCLGIAVLLSRVLQAPWYNGLLIGLVAAVFSFPLAASWMNRIGRSDKLEVEALVFHGMDARIKDRGVRQVGPVPEPDEYHLFLGDPEEPLRLIVPPDPYWLTLDKGDTVRIQWLPGRLAGRVYKGVLRSIGD